MVIKKQWFLPQEEDTQRLARAFASCADAPLIVLLYGDLGAGKTTFVRAFLRALGYSGAVKSPTYTLLEVHDVISKGEVYHFDLYRLADPEELAYLGVRDIDQEASIWFVEWPENGSGFLPASDMEIFIKYQEDGRVIDVCGLSQAGKKVIEILDF